MVIQANAKRLIVKSDTLFHTISILKPANNFILGVLLAVGVIQLFYRWSFFGVLLLKLLVHRSHSLSDCVEVEVEATAYQCGAFKRFILFQRLSEWKQKAESSPAHLSNVSSKSFLLPAAFLFAAIHFTSFKLNSIKNIAISFGFMERGRNNEPPNLFSIVFVFS